MYQADLAVKRIVIARHHDDRPTPSLDQFSKVTNPDLFLKLLARTSRYFPNDTELAVGMTFCNCTTSYKFFVSVKKIEEG